MEEKIEITEEMVAKVKEKFNALVAEVKETRDEIGKAEGFLGNVKAAFKAIPDVVRAVEEFAKEIPATGAEKKELAVKVINGLVNIPLMPESIEAVLIGFAVDMAVSSFNKSKNWISKE